jgi:hypothetical protein
VLPITDRASVSQGTAVAGVKLEDKRFAPDRRPVPLALML